MPRERESLPVTYYRLTVGLPCDVVFPSVTYTLLLISIPSAERHELTAHDSKRGKWPIIGPSYRAREFLEEAVFVAGVPVRIDTIGACIMRRMVAEHRAEVVVRPADNPAKKRPLGTQLGAWLQHQSRPTARIGPTERRLQPLDDAERAEKIQQGGFSSRVGESVILTRNSAPVAARSHQFGTLDGLPSRGQKQLHQI